MNRKCSITEQFMELQRNQEIRQLDFDQEYHYVSFAISEEVKK